MRRTSSIGTLRGLTFHGLMWTREAPPVERLRPDWQRAGCEEFRIPQPTTCR